MRIIRVVLLFAMLVAEGANAISGEDKERLAEMFSPILILTEENSTSYDLTEPIRVIKPEPVEIVRATNIASMWFDIPGIGQGHYLDSVLRLAEVDADSDLERARLYAPILILTKDGQEPTRKVIHPEPVRIMGAESADNLRFSIGSGDVTSFSGWNPTLQQKMNDLNLDVSFLQNKFAFLPSKAAKQENNGLRILKKVGVGTFSGTAFTLMAVGVHDKIWESSGTPDAVRAMDFFLFTGVIGWSVGFPLGVSSVDPYDSLPKTLLAGVIPGAVEVGLLLMNGFGRGFGMGYVGPVISSLIASELWRKPPQDRRVSVGLVPDPKGGLSAVAMLRF